MTAVNQAAYYGHDEAVGLLIQARADLERSNDAGRAPIHNSGKNGHVKIVGMLIEAKANLEATNNEVSPEGGEREIKSET